MGEDFSNIFDCILMNCDGNTEDINLGLWVNTVEIDSFRALPSKTVSLLYRPSL